MNNRIKKLRKSIGLTQEEFAKTINISRANLGSIETGRINVTDRIISDICREFDVNENWLRYGTGNMKIELSEDEELAKYVSLLIQDDDQIKKDLILTILKLDDEDWFVLKKIIKGLKKNKG